jgi:CheY-like chemotaxis protein
VRHLVEQHGGTVSAESAGEQRGATFTVNLPVTAVSAPPGKVEDEAGDGAPREQPRPHDGSSVLDGVRVLVVDDQADARELLSMVLACAGAEVLTADSAAAALDTLRRTRLDVLVSDIGMPDEDGFHLIGLVRSLPSEEGGATPAIALTAYATEEDRRRSLSAGFEDHLPKPVEPAELVALVAHLAARKDGRAAAVSE